MVEDRIVYGKIFTQGLVFEVLNLEPHYAIPYKLRDNVLVFEVMDVGGYFRTLLVSKESFAIVLYEPSVKSVKFLVEGEEFAKVDMSKVFDAEEFLRTH